MFGNFLQRFFGSENYYDVEKYQNDKLMNIDFITNINLKFYNFKFEENYLKFTNLYQNKFNEENKKLTHQVFSKDNSFSYSNLEDEIKFQIEQNDFWEYANEIINLKYYFYKYKNAKDRLKYSTDLYFPLTNLFSEFNSISYNIFSLVCKICNDRKNVNTMPFSIVKKLINILMNNPDEIKDEGFFILIKQLRNNKHIDKGFKEWKLFSIISTFVCPSFGAYFFILNFIYKEINEENQVFEIKQWGLYTMKKLINFKTKKERMVTPSMYEFQLIAMKKKFKVKIYFGNGSYENFFIEGYDTVKKLKKYIFEKFEMDDKFNNNFGILEVCMIKESLQENYIENEVLVADVLSSWYNENEFYEENNIKKMPKYRLYFKYRFIIENDEFIKWHKDKLDTFEYFNNYYNFNFGRFYCPNIDILTVLAGFKLFLEFGPYKREIKPFIKDELFNLIPKLSKNFYLDFQSILFDEIIENYKSVKNDSYLQVVRKFNKEFKEIDFNFGEFYNIRNEKSYKNDIPEFLEDMILMIKPNKIVFLNKLYEELLTINIENIVKWGYNDNFIYIIFKNEMEESNIKIKLKSKMTTTISYNLKSNINKFIGLNIEENNFKYNKNVTKGYLKNDFFKRVNEFDLREI